MEARERDEGRDLQGPSEGLWGEGDKQNRAWVQSWGGALELTAGITIPTLSLPV